MYNIPSARRRKKKFNPLNLIPILDVVFILIFFLLSTAQIMKVFEIGSDLPIFKVSNNSSPKNEELNLKVLLNNKKITFFNKVNGKVLGSLPTLWEDKKFFKDVNTLATQIKDEYLENKRVVFKVDKNVNYQNLIKVMDQVRKNHIVGTEARLLFTQIMFEN